MLTERDAGALRGLLGCVDLKEGLSACGEDAALYFAHLGSAARRYQRYAQHLALGAAMAEWAAVRLSLGALAVSLQSIGAVKLADDAAGLCARLGEGDTLYARGGDGGLLSGPALAVRRHQPVPGGLGGAGPPAGFAPPGGLVSGGRGLSAA